MTKKARELKQFDYRVRTVQDCIVTVEAYDQADADERVKDSSTWVVEQVVDFADFEIKGRA